MDTSTRCSGNVSACVRRSSDSLECLRSIWENVALWHDHLPAKPDFAPQSWQSDWGHSLGLLGKRRLVLSSRTRSLITWHERPRSGCSAHLGQALRRGRAADQCSRANLRFPPATVCSAPKCPQTIADLGNCGGGFQQESQTPTTRISLPTRIHPAQDCKFCNSRSWATLPASGFSAAGFWESTSLGLV